MPFLNSLASRMFYIALGVSLLVGFGAFTGCRPAVEKSIIKNDFEQYSGWLDQMPPWLTYAKSHSGHFACLVDAQSEFGISYTTHWQDLGKPQRLRLRTWTWLPNAHLKIALVLQVKRGENVLFWEVLPLNEVVRRYQQWEKAERDFVLPSDLQPDDEVKLFTWQSNPTHESVYLDDISLEMIN